METFLMMTTLYDDPEFDVADGGEWAQSAKTPRITPSIVHKREAKPKLSHEDIPVLTKNSETILFCDQWFCCGLRLLMHLTVQLWGPSMHQISENWSPSNEVCMDAILATVLNRTTTTSLIAGSRLFMRRQ